MTKDSAAEALEAKLTPFHYSTQKYKPTSKTYLPEWTGSPMQLVRLSFSCVLLSLLSSTILRETNLEEETIEVSK